MVDKPDLLGLTKDFAEGAHRVLLDSRQKTFLEAGIADIYDDVVEILPVVGDIIQNGPRIMDAVQQEDAEAIAVHGVNAAVGAVPAIGPILDLVIPANLILKGLDHSRCMEKGNSFIDCAVPEGTFERDLMSMAG